MKKSNFVMALLLVPLITGAVFLPMAAPVEAWGLVTHMFIDNRAVAYLSNASWQAAFEYYSPEVLGGSTTPDQAWQDWDNHLYYPETGEYNAPEAASRWFDLARNNFTAAAAAEGETAIELWEIGFFSAGVMSHYAADVCIPVHTDDIEDEIPDLPWPGHSAYEGEINSKKELLTLTAPTESIVTNVSQLVVDAAVFSHQYFDTIAAAYPDEDSTALSDTDVREATEACLSLAINNILSLFYTLTQGIDAPDVTITYDYVALFDYAHTNDYSDGTLTSVNQTLNRKHFQMTMQESAFTEGALTDVDLLVITCGFGDYSSAELTAIGNWAASGEKMIIITGRGDASESTDVATPNQVLEAINSDIRINDDNVYMNGTYRPWYNDYTTIPDMSETVGLTEDVNVITMYSPASLYFIADENPLPIVYSDVTGYQTDQTPPEITIIYDDTPDLLNGDQIIMMAAEEIGDLRVFVAGTTFFSDFDYGKTTFDNVELMENILDWAASSRSVDNIDPVDEVGPRISNVAWGNSPPAENESITITATVTDPSSVDNVTLFGTTMVDMINTAGDVYSAEFTDLEEGDEFWIEAYDNEGNLAIRADFTIEWHPEPTTTTTPTETTTTTPPPMDMTLFLIVGIGAIGVILVVVVIIKKR